jgi:hypothetical protein
MASSKRQTTFAKMQREQAVKERRARKQEKKDEKKQAAADLAAGIERDAPPPDPDGEAPTAARLQPPA